MIGFLIGFIICYFSLPFFKDSHSTSFASTSTETISKENKSSKLDINTIADTSKSLSMILNSGKHVYDIRDELENYKSKISENLYNKQFNINDNYVASLYEYTNNIGGYNFKNIFVETSGEKDKTAVILISTVNFSKDMVYTSDTKDETFSGFSDPIIYVTEVFTYSNSTGKLVDYIRYSNT